MARCVIFGGSGFIGSRLTRKLLQDGHEVTVFTRKLPQETDDAGFKDVTYYTGDFLNAHDINEATKNKDYVFHLVSLTNPAISEEDPYIDIETNVKMSIHLMESCVSNGVKKIIYTSSGGTIYGNAPRDSGVSESDPTEPISPYGIGKQTIEGYLRYYHHKHKLDYVSYRISNVYGIGQNTTNNKHGVISVFMNHILSDNPVTVYGDGSMTRDYINVEDLSNYIAKHFATKSDHQVFNIGSGEGTSINTILNEIQKVTGIKAKIQYMPAPAAYVQNIVLDCGRAEREFGPITTISLNEGIRKMLAHQNSDR